MRNTRDARLIQYDMIGQSTLDSTVRLGRIQIDKLTSRLDRASMPIGGGGW